MFTYNAAKIYVRKVTREECIQLNTSAAAAATAVTSATSNTSNDSTLSELKLSEDEVMLLIAGDSVVDDNKYNQRDLKDTDFVFPGSTAQVCGRGFYNCHIGMIASCS